MSDYESELEELEADFGDVMAILREGPLPAPSEAPSEAVWAAIAREAGGEIAASIPDKPRSAEVDPDGAAPVVSLGERRSRGRTLALITLAAAAALLVAVPLTLALGGDAADRRAQLLALEGFQGTGSAELDGRTLAVEVEGLDAPEGSFYELWLLDFDGEEVARLESLGRVDAPGSFSVPEDLDLDEFDVVDVSVEPDDGNPDHSGDSVLRGSLEPG